jgi:hypothetical protein
MANGKISNSLGPLRGEKSLTVLWANERRSQEKYYAESGLTDGLRNAKHGKELEKKKSRAKATRTQNIHCGTKALQKKHGQETVT